MQQRFVRPSHPNDNISLSCYIEASLDKATIIHQDQALRQASGQAFYNTSKFTLRDLKARASQQQLKAALDGYQVYADAEIEQLVTLYLGGADRDQLDEDGHVGFKGKAKAFGRAYGFLALILPYTSAEWEKSSIFLNFLVPISLRPWKRIFPKSSLSPSTWTATGSRRSRQCPEFLCARRRRISRILSERRRLLLSASLIYR